MTTEIKRIASQLMTQDNAMTSWPMYVVYRDERVYGVSPGYADKFTWICDEDEASDEVVALLNSMFSEESRDGAVVFNEGNAFRYVGYDDRPVFVTVCFTKEAADRYVEDHKHHGKMRVYVESGHSNREWQAVIRHLQPEIGSDGTGYKPKCL